jgi:hypothetical protein
MSLPLPPEDPWQPWDVVDRPVLRVTGPDQIAQLVPYILGFHPEDSLVLVALRGRRMVASVRNDLAAPIALVEPWCRAVTRVGADRVIGLLYCDDVTGQPLPHQQYVDELANLFDAHRLAILDLMAVSGGRWWSYHCRDESCCPLEGRPIDSSGVVAASAVSEGLVALPSRDELRRELLADDLTTNLVVAELDAMPDPEGDESSRRAADWATVRRHVKRSRTRPDSRPRDTAGVLLALSDKHVRDAAIGHLVAPPDPRDRETWRRLTTAAPVELRAAPATLYAAWCLADGSGARANVGIDVALDADPGYTLAHLLLELQATGANPFEVMAGLAQEAARVGRRIQRRRPPSGSSGDRRVAEGSATLS